MNKEMPPKKLPTEADFAVAEKEHPDWASLPTRKKNALAREQMFHREYYELSAAIMDFGASRRNQPPVQ